MLIYRGKLEWSESGNDENIAENEGVTIIFPTEVVLGEPVFAAWQWTGTKSNYLTAGTIDSMTVETDSTTIGFFYEGKYRFDGVFSSDSGKKTLTLTMSSEGKTTTTELALHYDKSSTDPTVPRINMGKMDWYEYATNELFLIVAPGAMDTGGDICVYWQWTHGQKSNIDGEEIIQSVEYADLGEKFAFRQGNYYKFNVAVNEEQKQLLVEMRNPTGDLTGPFTLDLQELFPSPPSRKLRAIFNVTTALVNDTDEILLCSLVSSGTGTTDSILAGLGLVLAGAGIALAYPIIAVPALALKVGLFVAHVSWVAAVGGAVQVFNKSGSEKGGLLFPGDSIQRRSSGGAFVSDNDVRVIRVAVDESQQSLVISSLEKEKVGSQTLSLQDLLVTGPLKPMLSIRLPSRQQLSVYRTVHIPHLKPAGQEKDIKDMSVADFAGCLTAADAKAETLWYGNVLDYYNRYGTSQSIMFKYDFSFSMQVTEGLDPTKESSQFFSVKVIPRSDANVIKYDEENIYLLKLNNCSFYYAWDSRESDVERNLGICTDEAAVLNSIRDNSSYWAYGWLDSRHLIGVKLDSDWSVIYNSNSNCCVYFVVKSWSPYHALELL